MNNEDRIRFRKFPRWQRRGAASIVFLVAPAIIVAIFLIELSTEGWRALCYAASEARWAIREVRDILREANR